MRSRITIISLLLIVFTTLSVTSQPGDKIRHLGTGEITTIAYSPDGTQIAVGSHNGIWIYDVHTGEDLRRFARREDVGSEGFRSYVIAVKFSPDGETLVSVSDSHAFNSSVANVTMCLWDVKNGTRIRTRRLASVGFSWGCALSPDGKTFANVERDRGDRIYLWDVKNGEHIQTLTPTGRRVGLYEVAFSPDGKTLASGDSDEKIHLWDVKNGTRIRTLTGNTDTVSSVAFSPDGKTLASGHWDGTIRLWDMGVRALIKENASRVYSVAFSPDGKTLASGHGDGRIYLWDVKNGKHIQALFGHRDMVSSVVFSPDGKTLASGSYDGTVVLWDPF